jgi:hypothetical protein
MAFLFIEEIDFRNEIKASVPPPGACWQKLFLASQMSINTEPFQRIDISVQLLGFAL